VDMGYTQTAPRASLNPWKTDDAISQKKMVDRAAVALLIGVLAVVACNTMRQRQDDTGWRGGEHNQDGLANAMSARPGQAASPAARPH